VKGGSRVATIYDVAQKAGVSAKTVSRVLNGDGPVGPETRAAVTAAMAELGYVPSNAARMMRSQRSGLVGIITGAISTAATGDKPTGLPELIILQGIQQTLSHTPLTVMIADIGNRPDRVPQLFDTFLRHRVEGLIYIAEYHQEVTLPRLPAATPVVLANCFDRAGTPCVLPDDRRGQYDLVRRLIGAGHRRIAYLTLFSSLKATILRTEGYRMALADAGLPFDPTLVESCELADSDGETQLLWDAIDRMLHLPDPPTVLCCGNDKMALTVYGILRSRGVRVPDDISVAGFDNHRVIAETLYPPLTTVELAYNAMGARAAQRLLALIASTGRDDIGAQLVCGPVHWRGSVTNRRAPPSLLQLVRED
jgi:LacI family transcriptional regulator